MADTIANPAVPSMSKVLDNAAQLHRLLEEAGLSPEARQRAIDEPAFRRELVGFWMGGSPTSTTTPHEAAQIMGSNFHGPGDVEATFGVKFTQKQRKLLGVVPFSTELLQACSETHVLVAGFALSIMDMHGKLGEAFYAKNEPWYGASDQRFATSTKVTVGWHLVLKTELPGSTSKKWDDQVAMVDAQNTIPPACLVVFAMAVHYKLTGERIIQQFWVRTSDVTAYGHRVIVVFLPEDVYVIRWDGRPNGYIGVAVSRKSS